MTRIAIFASGNGSNAENICNYFNQNPQVEVALIITNNPNAFVLERAKKLGVQSAIFSKSEFSKAEEIARFLEENVVNWIVLSGFLLKVPEPLIARYPNRIVNIHPALLPKYGGKGMYGDHVHRAVIAGKEKESGITVHLVNAQYDEGKTVFQAKCPVLKHDTHKTLAKKIHALEYEHFPKVIAALIGNEE